MLLFSSTNEENKSSKNSQIVDLEVPNRNCGLDLALITNLNLISHLPSGWSQLCMKACKKKSQFDILSKELMPQIKGWYSFQKRGYITSESKAQQGY